MKWPTNSETNPELGTIRRRKVLAILPIACSDGFTRCLEHVMLVERFGYTLELGGIVVEEWQTVHYEPCHQRAPSGMQAE